MVQKMSYPVLIVIRNSTIPNRPLRIIEILPKKNRNSVILIRVRIIALCTSIRLCTYIATKSIVVQSVWLSSNWHVSFRNFTIVLLSLVRITSFTTHSKWSILHAAGKHIPYQRSDSNHCFLFFEKFKNGIVQKQKL